MLTAFYSHSKEAHKGIDIGLCNVRFIVLKTHLFLVLGMAVIMYM